MGYRVRLGDLGGGQGRQVPSKDMRQRQLYFGLHTCMQSSTRRQFDEDVDTYHSAKSSVTHSPVRRGRVNIFGGKGRILPLQCDVPQLPAGSMPPLSQLPLRHRARTPSQPPRPSMPSGKPREMPFSGVPMGISMPPPVQSASLPAARGWAAQLGVLALQGADAKSIAGSAGEECRRERWPSAAVGPQNRPARCSDSESSSQQESTSTCRHDLRHRSHKSRSQRQGGQFGQSQPMFAPLGIPTFQYLQQLAQTHSLGTKSKTDLPIHTSPSHPPTSGSAKRQAVKLGQTPGVHAEHRR